MMGPRGELKLTPRGPSFFGGFMTDFVTSMLNLVFWPFSQVTDTYFFVVIAGVFLFCFSLAFIMKLMHLFIDRR